VTDAEFLERFDRHLERGGELMDANRRALERNGEAFEANRRALEDNRRAFEDQRRFTEEILLCFDKVVERHERTTERQIAKLDRVGTKLDTVHRTVEDHRDESRAILQAIFAVLDRLEGGGSAPAT